MKVLKKISKYLVYLLISIIILFFGIYLFIQTDTFNKWALGYTIEKINDSWVSKDCKVNAESIEGNILKGLKLNNGNVIVKNDTLISFNCLIVNYNLWDLLNKKITIESLTLNSPDINLVSRKVNDSLVWNFSKLISTDETQDTSSEKFGWDIEVQNLKIEAGKVRIAGNYREDIPLWKLNRRISNFNYDSLDINELELDMEAKYLKNSKSFNVRNLSFVTNSDFYLKKFSLNAEVNESDTVTDIHSLELITGRSEMFLKNVKVNSFNPLDSLTYNNFYTKQLNAEISINRFDFADLRYFIPGMEMLDSIVALHLDLNGNYNNLKINDLTLKLPNSIIAFNGMVNNLENPSQLYLDIKTKELSVYPSDINTVYHSSLIPDYSQLGKVEGKILYRGTFSSFYSDFELKTGAGNIDGNATLDLDRESYSGLITTSSLNLSKILNDRSKNSSINCAVKFEGSGFSLAKLNADIIYSVDNSKVMGYGISSSAGNIKASNSNFEMNIKAITSAGNGVIVGKVNIANLKDPVYILKGKVNNLDISKFTNDPEDKSNINTAFDINGRGSGLNNINGKFNFSVENSKYSKYLIPKTPVNIRIQSTGGKGSISAITDIAELHAEGVFDLGTISDAVRYNLSTFSNLVYKTSGQDSLITMVSSVKPVNRNVNLKFEFFIKDSLRFAQISSPFGINFNGGLKGSLTNSSEYFSTGLNINIKNFSYMDTVFVLRDVHSDLLFRNNFDSENNEGFSPYNIVFNTSGSRIVYNGTEIDSSLLKFELADGRAAFSVSAKQDSTIKGMVLGLISLKDKKITLNIDSLNADYGLYNVQNGNKWVFEYIPSKEIYINQMSLKSRNVVLNVEGIYSFDENSDIKISSDKVSISSILTAVSPDKKDSQNQSIIPLEGDVSDFIFTFKGTKEKPELYTEINTGIIKYEKDEIGKVNAKIQYKDEFLIPDIVFSNPKNSGKFSIDGSIPVSNPLIEYDILNNIPKPVKLDLLADNFQIAGFSRFVPVITDLKGNLKGEINGRGTKEDLELKGDLKIDKGVFLYSKTGMNYGFNLDISTADSKLLIDNLSLFSRSDNSRHLDISGNIDFSGLKLNDIDLTTKGDMVILDKSAERNELGVYGYLYGGSGDPPIKIKGNFERLDVTGEFLIKDAEISSVPIRGGSYDELSDNFTYINSSSNVDHSLDTSIVITPEMYVKINPFERYKYNLTEKASTYMDYLNLDINVRSQKSISAVLEMKNLTRDRLYGEANVDLNIKTENKQFTAYGAINIVGNSYYRFYRDFKIKDSKLVFNGPLGNPELDIQAVYVGKKSSGDEENASTVDVKVLLSVKGQIDSPKVEIKLDEGGTQISGSDAQSDAITFLLFGKYKSDLSTSQKQSMATSLGTQLGSLYLSSYAAQLLRGIAPFIVDAELNYSEGNSKSSANTNFSVTSKFGDATVKVGDRLINAHNYFEFEINYPINNTFRLNLPEDLIIEIIREPSDYNESGNNDVSYRNVLQLSYKIKY